MPVVASSEPRASRDSCRSRIAETLQQILQRNLDTSNGPPLVAFQALNPSALAQAEALDRATSAQQPKGPLHCMPIAVKANFAITDLPMTVGSLSLVGNQPIAEGVLLRRLREAGAIVIGTTTMDEFAVGISGISGTAGRVGNAINSWLTPGGSSSGSGVAVGAGLVPLAAGSDNCGSLRLPAVYNGAVSLRPSLGRFPSDGMFPLGETNGTPGLIAHDLRTLNNGLGVMAPQWQTSQSQQAAALVGRRIGVLTRAGAQSLEPTTTEARRLLNRGITLLRAAGAVVEEKLVIHDFHTNLGRDLTRGGVPAIDQHLASYPAARRSWADICQSGRIPPEWTPTSCQTMLRADPPAQRRAQRAMESNRGLIEALLKRRQLDALLLLPDRQGGAQSQPSDVITCFVSGYSGVPAVVLPIGLDNRGLPVGVELLGAYGTDEALMAMATHLETQRGALSMQAAHTPANTPLTLTIPQHNNAVVTIGWRSWLSRKGSDPGDLEPARFRRLTEAVVREQAYLAAYR